MIDKNIAENFKKLYKLGGLPECKRFLEYRNEELKDLDITNLIVKSVISEKFLNGVWHDDDTFRLEYIKLLKSNYNIDEVDKDFQNLLLEDRMKFRKLESYCNSLKDSQIFATLSSFKQAMGDYNGQIERYANEYKIFLERRLGEYIINKTDF